ncbi:MAG: 2-hydroxyacyl-CoA dehydratase [Syntrophaceae bacterium]|nr:2-hydroxyacyl-CoA dehydratase [Syntrophaceae bacterium]
MDMFKNIGEISGKAYNAYLQAAKENGRKIAGYFCQVPVEVLHAAGLIPYRMRAVGSSGTTKGDIYYSPLNCTFTRHCFDKALRGGFDFLDAVIFMNGCDHTRRMYDNWRHARKTHNINPDFLYMFITPHVVAKNTTGRYTEEIRKFSKYLSETFGTDITNDLLLNSIKLFNKQRRLIAKIYEKRKSMGVTVKGSDILSMMLAVTAMPVDAANELLERINASIDNNPASEESDIRVLITGGCIEEIDMIRIIEGCHAVVVADNLSHGARYFDMEVDETGYPVESLAKRYLYKLSCPRMINAFDIRMKYIYDTIREYKIDAVITQKLKFCDLWGVENLMLKKEAQRTGFPLLALERELYGEGIGQLKTRIQAFIEEVRNRKSGVGFRP